MKPLSVNASGLRKLLPLAAMIFLISCATNEIVLRDYCELGAPPVLSDEQIDLMTEDEQRQYLVDIQTYIDECLEE